MAEALLWGGSPVPFQGYGSEWNIPMFDVFGQRVVLEDHFWCDTCVTLVLPKQEICAVLRENLRHLGWEDVGLSGGCLGASSSDGAEELWRIAEDGLRLHFVITELSTATAAQTFCKKTSEESHL